MTFWQHDEMAVQRHVNIKSVRLRLCFNLTCFTPESCPKEVYLSKEKLFLYDLLPIGRILKGTSALDLPETDMNHWQK
jgi:hypothetical protein